MPAFQPGLLEPPMLTDMAETPSSDINILTPFSPFFHFFLYVSLINFHKPSYTYIFFSCPPLPVPNI